MKMHKSVELAKEYWKIHMWKIKKYCKVTDHCHCTGEYGGAAYSICNSKCSVPKRISIVFHNSSNHDYHLIIAEELKKKKV